MDEKIKLEYAATDSCYTDSFRHGGGSVVFGGGEAEFMHHPLRFGAFASKSCVVNERFFEADASAGIGGGVNGPVDAGRFPETGTGHSVWSDAVPVFPPSEAEEEEFLRPSCDH